VAQNAFDLFTLMKAGTPFHGPSGLVTAGLAYAKDSLSGGGADWIKFILKSAAPKGNEIARLRESLDIQCPISGSEPLLSIPPGITVITGTAGTGKTKFLNDVIQPSINEAGLHSWLLELGEPGSFVPYSHDVIDRALGVVSLLPAKERILLVDSLLASWFDPSLVSGFPLGKGGASFGVPAYLNVIGTIALFTGVRLVAILHPLFNDVSVIEGAISGVVSCFINVETGDYISRPYESFKAGADIKGLTYRRQTGTIPVAGSDGSTLTSLLKGMGDED